MARRLILEGDESTAIVYTIEGGMDSRDADEYESMDSVYVNDRGWNGQIASNVDLRHRLNYLRKRGLGLGSPRFAFPEFEAELESIFPSLKRIVPEMVKDAYYNGTVRISELMENLCRSPRFGPSGNDADAAAVTVMKANSRTARKTASDT